ncbi:MAG TPA: phage minor head protein [Verrucomicrobiae bacterium]|nr:phage minor head protein [Verrucomicrobiae bacterium]
MIVKTPSNFSEAIAALQKAGKVPADISPELMKEVQAELRSQSEDTGKKLMDDIFGIYRKHLSADHHGVKKLSVPDLMKEMKGRAKKSVTLAKHDQARAQIGKIYLRALNRVLAHVKKESLANLSGKGAPSFANATAPAAADFPFDLSNFSKMFFAQMREAGEEALEQSGKVRAAELGLDEDQFVTSHGIAKKFLIERANKLKDVPQEIYDTLKQSLEAGSKAGETELQLSARVANVLGDIDDGRAQTIARTETASAYGTASQDAIKQAGFTHKSWLTAHDGKVRSSHEECEDQGAIPNDHAFSNGLMFPGDPEGEAEEVINCRCVLQAEEGPEDEEDEA